MIQMNKNRIICLLCLVFLLTGCHNNMLPSISDLTSNLNTIGSSSVPSIDNSIPKELLEFMEKNPEAKDYVLNYLEKKDIDSAIDLSNLLDSSSVPLLIQWDERWGYTEYAGELFGLSGCGPTCLSMVCVYLMNDAKYSPRYIAEFATENGYSVPGNGSSWTLISEGGVQLGVDITEIPLDENRIIRNLEVGNPIICVMGPGFFTTTGHYIVMTEYKDGYVKVNDPNSPNRSEQTWKLTEVMDQIRNLWVCRYFG